MPLRLANLQSCGGSGRDLGWSQLHTRQQAHLSGGLQGVTLEASVEEA